MPVTGSGRKGISFAGTTEYSDEELVYLRKIDELRQRLKGSRASRQPTTMEIAEVILETARELGYRKLTPAQVQAFDVGLQKAENLRRMQEEADKAKRKKKNG
jgi:hypothetical protein